MVLVIAAVVVGLPILAVCGMVFWFSVKARLAPSKRPEIERILGEAEAQSLEWTRDVASSKAAHGASNEMVVNRSAFPANKSPMSVHTARLIQDIRSELASGGAEEEQLSARASALVAPSFWTRDLTVVIEREVAPRLDQPDAGTFESGAERGLAYVFDYQQEKVICVAEFFSTNSEVVRFAALKGAEGVSGKIAISDDLQANVLESAKHALYRTDTGAR